MKDKKMIVIILAALGLVAILFAVLLMNNKKEIVTYQVMFNTSGGTSVETQVINEGDKVTKPVDPTKEGYIFVEWQLDGISYDFNQIVTKDLTLNAKWTKVEEGKETYVVKFNSDGGTTISNQVIEKGNKVTKPSDPTKEGYIFKGWFLEDKTYDFNSVIEKDIELTAKWERITYTVKFNSNGGSNVTSKTIGEGDKVTKPGNPSREGYAFVEWQLNGKAYDFNSKVTKNIELKAVWKELAKYTVTFNSDGGSNLASQSIYEGNKVTKPGNPTKEDYTFVEWQLDGKAYDFNSKVTKNIELKAVWKKVNKYTATFNSDGGTNVTSQTVVEGNKVTKPGNPTKDDYTFVEWQLDGKPYDFNSKVTKNIELKAVWKKVNKYTVTFNSDGGSNVISQTITEGNKVIKPQNPTKEGYNFNGWTLNGNNYDFNSVVNSDITLTAKWSQKNYTVVAKKADLTAPFSRVLTVYEDGVEKEVKTIQYIDGVTICSGTNPNVNYYAINEETELKLVLNSGTVVTASLTIEN